MWQYNIIAQNEYVNIILAQSGGAFNAAGECIYLISHIFVYRPQEAMSDDTASSTDT